MAELLDGNIASSTSRSVARSYPQGVSLITSGRPRLVSVAIQNLHASSEVRFWHGLIPVDPFDLSQGYLPEDPNDWDGSQTTNATNTISTYGERVKAGEYLEPFVTPHQQVYSYVASGTVNAHVKEGY